MRLVWQIVRKDLWRQRWWISLWLLSGSTMLLTRTAELVIQHGQTVRGMGGGDMFGLWALLTFGLVAFFMPARAVLDDPLVDSNAQWRTRPISMGRLLAAKIVFIVGLIARLLWIEGLLSKLFLGRPLGDQRADRHALAVADDVDWDAAARRGIGDDERQGLVGRNFLAVDAQHHVARQQPGL